MRAAKGGLPGKGLRKVGGAGDSTNSLRNQNETNRKAKKQKKHREDETPAGQKLRTNHSPPKKERKENAITECHDYEIPGYLQFSINRLSQGV